MSHESDVDELTKRINDLERKIEDLKQEKESLLTREQKYQSIFNDIEDGYYEVDIEGNYTYFNDAVCHIIGYSREELLKMNNRNYTTPEAAKKMFQIFNEVYRSGVPAKVTDYEVIRKDGTQRMVELSISLMRDADGAIIGFRGIGRDITDRKLAEEALRKSEAKYRELVENANSIILRRDMGGRITFINEFAQSFFGYTEDEILGQNVVGTIVPEKDSGGSDLAQMVKDIGLHPEKYVTNENENMRSNGDRVWVAWTNKAIYDREGTIREMLCIGNDITERKKAEEEKKKLEAELYQARKMEAIGTLVGGLAHDFNNLLMGLQGRISLMLLDLDSGHPHYENLKQQEAIIKNGADLTRQLLGFARDGKYEVKPVNINEIIHKTSDMFGRTKKEVTISRKFEDDIWTVEVDQSQIEQVFVNIYINAWQAMPGGGHLYIETENVNLEQNKVSSFTIPQGPYVKISITDTGVGMDEATKERIFEPFFTTREMGRGTGLGLASVYGIIKNHDGFIDVSSEKGHGTTFYIYLPAIEKKIGDDKVSPKTEILQGTETILLVDDERIILDVGEEVLKTMGYNVLLAGSGKEALEHMERYKESIDMVILDMIMPEMSGGEVFDRIKKIKPDIKVLLSSGYSYHDRAREILDRGCNGFIQKPYRIEDLSKKIREILSETV
ncbi:MAG: PAS domain S-box protein [Deltaproteobacteria bacterium]|nr:PAS domain S-box protein [Deltaproteobacteria bacterium]